MTQLAKNLFRRPFSDGTPVTEAHCPADADEIFYVGAFALSSSTSNCAVRCTATRLTVASTYRPIGIVCTGALPADPGALQDPLKPALDMTGLTAGTWSDPKKCVRLFRRGVFEIAVAAGFTPRPGGEAHLVDENTVGGTATTSLCKAGRFVQPSRTSGYWFVDISYMGA